MTSRVTPKQCSLREAVGEHEHCPGSACLFWEDGGAVVEPGCAIERLGVPLKHQRILPGTCSSSGSAPTRPGRLPSAGMLTAASRSC